MNTTSKDRVTLEWLLPTLNQQLTHIAEVWEKGFDHLDPEQTLDQYDEIIDALTIADLPILAELATRLKMLVETSGVVFVPDEDVRTGLLSHQLLQHELMQYVQTDQYHSELLIQSTMTLTRLLADLGGSGGHVTRLSSQQYQQLLLAWRGQTAQLLSINDNHEPSLQTLQKVTDYLLYAADSSEQAHLWQITQLWLQNLVHNRVPRPDSYLTLLAQIEHVIARLRQQSSSDSLLSLESQTPAPDQEAHSHDLSALIVLVYDELSALATTDVYAQAYLSSPVVTDIQDRRQHEPLQDVASEVQPTYEDGQAQAETVAGGVPSTIDDPLAFGATQDLTHQDSTDQEGTEQDSLGTDTDASSGVVDGFIAQSLDLISDLQLFLPIWQQDAQDPTALTEIRSSFTDLKTLSDDTALMVPTDETSFADSKRGISGISDMAGSVEALLDHLLQHPERVVDEVVDFVSDTVAQLPKLIDGLADHTDQMTETHAIASGSQAWLKRLTAAPETSEAASETAPSDANLAANSADADYSESGIAAFQGLESTAALYSHDVNDNVSAYHPAEDQPENQFEDQPEYQDVVADEETPTAMMSGHAMALADAQLPEVLTPFIQEAVDAPRDDRDADPDIKEIFIEEAEEILEQIVPMAEQWQLALDDMTLLKEIRRGFHTLKGSGRMVGANYTAEIAWSIENMLNRVLDNTITASPAIATLVSDVLSAYPDMMTAFAHDTDNYPAEAPVWIACAHAYSQRHGDAFDYTEVKKKIHTFLNERLTAATVDHRDSGTSVDSTLQTFHSVNEIMADASLAILPQSEEEHEFFKIFIEEAEELLKEISDFIDLHQDSSLVEVSDDIVRAFHILRAASGSSALAAISEVSATIEKSLEQLQQQDTPMTAQHITALTQSVTLIDGYLNNYKQSIEQQAINTANTESDQDLVSLQAMLDKDQGTTMSEYQLSIAELLEDGIDALLDAEWQLTQTISVSNIEQVKDYIAQQRVEIERLRRKTRESQKFSTLLSALDHAYTYLSAHPQKAYDSDIQQKILAGHAQLVGLFDALAASMSLKLDATVLDNLIDIKQTSEDQPSTQQTQPLQSASVDDNDQSNDIVDVNNDIGILVNDDRQDQTEDVTDESLVDTARSHDDVSADEATAATLIDNKGIEDNAIEDNAIEDKMIEDSAINQGMTEDRFATTIADNVDSPSAAVMGADDQRAADIYTAAVNSRHESDTGIETLHTDAELLDIFLEEAEELDHVIGQAFAKWRNDIDSLSQLKILQRYLHTIKGGARMADIKSIADLAHAMEHIFEDIIDARIKPDAQWVEVMQRAQDVLSLQISHAVREHQSIVAASLVAQLQQFSRETTLPKPVTLILPNATLFNTELAQSELPHLALADSESSPVEVSAADPAAADAPVAQDQADPFGSPVDKSATTVNPSTALPAPATQAPAADAEPSVQPTPPASLSEIIARSWPNGLPDSDILAVFLEEAEEITNRSEDLSAYAEDPNDTEAVQALQRDLHTLKGGARMVDATGVADLAHEMETIYEYSAAQRLSNAEAVIPLMLACHDWLAEAIVLLKWQVNPPLPTSLVTALRAFIADPARHVAVPEDALSSLQDAIEQTQIAAHTPATPLVTAYSPNDTSESSTDPLSQTAPADTDRGSDHPSSSEATYDISTMPAMSGQHTQQEQRLDSNEMIRIPGTLIEHMINLSAESAINRSRIDMGMSSLTSSIEEMGTTVLRLADQLRRMELELETQILSQIDPELMNNVGFDPLEMDQYSSLNQISKSLTESASDLIDINTTLLEKTRDSENLLLQLSRTQTELQDGLMNSRMVPFSRLKPRLERTVRQTASQLNKKVALTIRNAEGEIDRTILERMTSPLEHMLRNAVDHGIETVHARQEAGKSAQGHILLEMRREGGEIVIVLTDDGAGIDVEAVRRKAISQGLIDEGDTRLTDADVMQYIFNAGITTTQKVTQISGRGVGMDVVISEIRQLGGTVSVTSTPGQGSRFTIRVPLTVAMADALVVRAADRYYAIPLVQIERVVQVNPQVLQEYYHSGATTLKIDETDYRVRYLNEVLSGHSMSDLMVTNNVSLPLIIIKNSSGQDMAMQVDQIAGSRTEIVVKPLGRPLANVSGISGATIMGDGSVMLILDLIALMRHSPIIEPAAPVATQASKQVAAQPHILIVDDSVTVRKVTSRFLERHEFTVSVAKDGIDAVEILQETLPDLILLDIEMPRMDGFEVATQIRNSERLQHIPIIMITSRTGKKHRMRALEIGVNDYMGKPFQEDTLISTIERLLEHVKET